MSQQRILIIDDDPDIVKTLTANLELDGYAVWTAIPSLPPISSCWI